MNGATLPAGRSLVARGTTAALATVLATTVAGLGAAAPAHSADNGAQCPQAYPVDSLVKGQSVTGLTVVEGTTPEEFTGKVLGVLNDGIAPGVDMILARLSSPEVDRVGVWSGMSGSPVYAEDGRLVGAVAYTMTWGATPVAGVTPAEDMAAILASGRLQSQRAETDVDLPDRLQDRLVAQGVATPAQAESGMSPLRLPLGISGVNAKRRDQIDRSLDRADKAEGFRTVRMGTAGSGGPAASDITAGGNLAAAISYGDVSFAALGTTTMVCDEQVVAFGHPFFWTGPAALSMHPAEALFIQEDPGWSGFKVGNVGKSVGTIAQDRLAGIAGPLGPIPDSATVTTDVSSGNRSRQGSTDVYLGDWVPEVALTALLSNEDRIFDGYGEGSGEVSYKVVGRRADGSRFRLTRSDLYADKYDLAWETVDDLYMALARVVNNRSEDVTITKVDAQAALSRDYDHARIHKLYVKRAGKWRRLGPDARQFLTLRVGKKHKFLVKLQTPDGVTRKVVELPVQRRDLGQRGQLKFRGGNSLSGGYFYNGGGSSKQTFDELLADIKNEAHNDDIVAKLRYRQRNRSGERIVREKRVATGTVTNGSISVNVRIVR